MSHGNSMSYGNSISNPRVEEDILQSLDRVKSIIGQNNAQQVSNIQAVAFNLRTLLTYANAAISALLASFSHLQNTHKQLLALIRQQGLGHLLTPELREPLRNKELEALNAKINDLIVESSQHGGLSGLEREGLDGKSGERRGLGGRAERSKKADRERTALQFKLAIKYVNEHLAQTLEVDEGNVNIPKSVILNLFVHWNQQRGYELDRSHLNVLQMALTNELKRRFPNATHNYYVFRGLRFRPEYGHLMKLADSSQGAESGGGNEESEELPGFEDDHLADD